MEIKMSKLDERANRSSSVVEMIKELCPNGVEYKTIEEVCEISRGIVISKDFIRDNAGEYPVYSSQTENEGCLGFINTFKYDGEYLTWTTDGANAGTVFYRNGRFSITNVCGLLKVIEKNLSSKFLYYALSISAPNYVNRGMGNAKLMSNVMASIKIPIPPLPVQEEIVRILDTFTSLTAELTAELTARRKQYEYYRDALLTPPFGSTTLTDRNNQIRLLSNVEASKGTREAKVEFFKLKDLCKSIKDGMHNLPKSSLESGDYPILSAQNIYNNQIDYNAKRFVDSDIFVQENKRTNVEEGDVLLTIVATIGRSAVVKENRKVLLQRSVCALKPNEKVLPGYLKYSLDKSEIQNYMIKNAHGSAQAGLYLNQVEEITIPLPPLSVQQRIVDVLDNFDAICSDLKIGLPAEIDARKKQYEYYRDLLLTFAERGNTIFADSRQQTADSR